MVAVIVVGLWLLLLLWDYGCCYCCKIMVVVIVVVWLLLLLWPYNSTG